MILPPDAICASEYKFFLKKKNYKIKRASHNYVIWMTSV